MGALSPLMSVAGAQLVTQGLGLVGGLSNREFARRQSQNSQEVALKQLQAQQRLQESQLARNALLEREKIALNTANAESDRKAALRRAVARQRAGFGSRGVGSGVGSSQAVLLGMFEESESERTKREGLDNLRLNALDQDVGNRKSLNVLQRSQLAERNKLDDLASKGNAFSNIAGFAGRIF